MKTAALHVLALLSVPVLLPSAASAASFLANPSFELDAFPTFPGYIGGDSPPQITDWSGTGGHGVNQAAGPFHNGGTPVPDQLQVAFIQGVGSLSQPVTGLTPGQTYWIQFFYDARGCCGGTIDLSTKWDDAALDTLTNVQASTGGAPYKFRNIAFTPEAESGVLSFSTTAAGDATAVLDAVCIVPGSAGQVVVMNPSFEASGTPPEPGTVAAAAGWTGTGAGAGGINNASGPFADNGAIPEQDHVGFLQGDLSISQTLRGLAAGETYALTFRYNARSGNTPQLAVSVDGTTVFNQPVAPVGGATAYRTATANFTATATSAVLSFAQTAAGDQTVLLDDIRVSGVVVEPIPNLRVGPPQVELGPGSQSLATVTVSARRLEASAATVQLRIANPAVARLVDADENGLVTLVFPQGSPETALTTAIEGVDRGATALEIVDNGGHDGVDGSVLINVSTSFVLNPSFETGGPWPGVGDGAIPAWTGGSGGNNATQPFFDNGQLPDRDHVGFIQGSGSLTQTVTGLTTGQRYAVQAFYNVRNCCDGGTMGLTVRFDGNDLADIPDVVAVGPGAPFYFLNAGFTATGPTGSLQFASTAAGDASLLLDAVCIVPQEANEVVVKNPSFEASGIVAYPGYQGAMAGWAATGGHGVNIETVGPFADNGLAGAQDRVAFMQGPSSLTQVIEGLTAGSSYSLEYLVNARNGDSPGGTPYRVLIDGTEVLNAIQDPVGPGNPYAPVSLPFTAAGETVEIKFEGISAGTVDDDQSLLLDHVRILPASSGLNVQLSIALIAGNSVNLSWPVSAPAGLVLQSSTTMAPASWTLVTTVPFVDGGNNNVLEVIDGPARFYRLARP